MEFQEKVRNRFNNATIFCQNFTGCPQCWTTIRHYRVLHPVLPECVVRLATRWERRTYDSCTRARQLQEKCQEQNVDLYMTFVDLTKAFDTVVMDSEKSWPCLAIHTDS